MVVQACVSIPLLGLPLLYAKYTATSLCMQVQYYCNPEQQVNVCKGAYLTLPSCVWGGEVSRGVKQPCFVCCAVGIGTVPRWL